MSIICLHHTLSYYFSRSLNHFTVICYQLAQKFSAYGSVDICMQSPNQALVAMSNVGT